MGQFAHGSSYPTPKDLKKLAESVGATLEEDPPVRDMRIFQFVAPKGKWWVDVDGPHLVVYWGRGCAHHTLVGNLDTYQDVKSRVACGFQDCPEGEDDEE